MTTAPGGHPRGRLAAAAIVAAISLATGVGCSSDSDSEPGSPPEGSAPADATEGVAAKAPKSPKAGAKPKQATDLAQAEGEPGEKGGARAYRRGGNTTHRRGGVKGGGARLDEWRERKREGAPGTTGKEASRGGFRSGR
jgi:hypothetical protein